MTRAANHFASCMADLELHLAAERAIRSLGSLEWADVLGSGLRVDDLRRSADTAGDVARSLRQVPDREVLSAVGGILSDALGAKASRKIASLAVAVMFDARAQQPANPMIYIDRLVFDLVDLGFPPAVVAGACQRLRRETVPVPEIAEVIAACVAVQADYATARDRCARALADRQVAEHASQRAPAQPVDAPRLNVPSKMDAATALHEGGR